MADRHEASKASKNSPIDEYRECVAHDAKFEGMHAAARDCWSESLKVFGAHGREKMLSFATASEKREITPLTGAPVLSVAAKPARKFTLHLQLQLNLPTMQHLRIPLWSPRPKSLRVEAVCRFRQQIPAN